MNRLCIWTLRLGVVIGFAHFTLGAQDIAGAQNDGQAVVNAQPGRIDLTGRRAVPRGPDYERPPLFFREDWKNLPRAQPITQEHIEAPNMIMTLYGNDSKNIRKSHHSDIDNYLYTGETTTPWALTLHNPTSYVDLSDLGRIRWRAKQSGFRKLHVVLRLAGGTLLVSEEGSGETADWLVTEHVFSDLRWRGLDPTTMTAHTPYPAPDLTKVDEIGFADLMPGGLIPSSSRVDWWEVYGRSVER